MDYAETANYLRRIGFKAQESPHGLWYGAGPGLLVRVPPYVTTRPPEGEVHTLFRRSRLLGLKYSLEPGRQGRPAGVYFVRDRDYDLHMLSRRMRGKTRRGLEHCRVRRMRFDELYCLGMPLNIDTLARQNRKDQLFTNPDRWARYCRAGDEADGVQAWGGFIGDNLAAYATLLRVGQVVNIVNVMSRTDLLKFQSNPALIFAVTQTTIRSPDVVAVCSGPEGISSDPGLEDFKLRMGYEKEAVNFVVRLRPVIRHALLNRISRWVISAMGDRFDDSDSFRRFRGVLDIAAVS